MGQVTEAFAKALADHAGEVVIALVAALLAVVEAGRRAAIAYFARAAVEQHDDAERAAEYVDGLPRLVRPLRQRNVHKAVAREMLRRRLSADQRQVSAIETVLEDEDKTPASVKPPGGPA